ncbi:tsukushin-like isoform X1 [Agrilus planipennis]|uniref:Tsukushin-like isoform X1 n=1 Tax=Agrilus planipennis TaxID=224129 RepID=A0A1W4XF28_AGRPL|nr:tsukushin-like isoform X1 [Agrilus planipennis]
MFLLHIRAFAFLYLLEIGFGQSSSSSLCSIPKQEHKCLCSVVIDSELSYNVMHKLDCSRNGFDSFPDYQLITEAGHLDLSFNKIEKLDGSVSNVENPVLHSLILSFNSIYYVSTDYFKNLPNLKHLDLSHNDIASFVNSNVFNGLSKLEVLDLSFNSISTLPEYIFYPLSGLRSLDISYNYLGALFTKLDNIFNSTLGLTKEINKLSMNGLDIKYVLHTFFDGANQLTYLSVADNPLLEVPTIPYSVTYLDISGTWVAVLQGKHLNYHSLQILKMNRMPNLRKIDRYAFYTLQSLIELEMNDNPNLKDLESVAFGILSEKTDLHLKKMSVARCGLKGVNESYQFLFNKLDYIDLQGNPFTCDCNIFWLQKFEDSLNQKQNLRCVKPLRLRMKNILDLTHEDLPQCESEENQKQKVIIIVLSVLIAVLIIFVVYLIYLGPLYYQNKYREIGPDSPYGLVVDIQPNRVE